MKIALHGASGRMGAALVTLLRHGDDKIVGAVAARGAPEVGRDLGEVHGLAPMGVLVQDDVGSGILGADVVVDFSHASAVAGLMRQAKRAGVPVVSGTTGLETAATEAMQDASRSIAVLWAPNFSLGIHVLAELVRHAVARLGKDFDVEIVETHHRGKADAPSGTAVRLAKEVEAVRADARRVYGREGMVGARTPEQLAVLAVRGGDVVGDHTVHLLGLGERLELTHRATSREVFARGALFAARALIGRPAGRYGLGDVLPPV